MVGFLNGPHGRPVQQLVRKEGREHEVEVVRTQPLRRMEDEVVLERGHRRRGVLLMEQKNQVSLQML